MHRLRLFFASAAVLLISISPPQAHQSNTGQDYTKYRQPNGLSCCSGHDCRPARFEFRNGTLVMFPEGRAVAVPNERVNQQPSEDGLGHWCGVLHRDGGATTFCAILPLHSTSNPTKHAALDLPLWSHMAHAAPPD